MGPLSLDLRKRVVTAIREEGMSCRAAARQFKVSYASAIRWAQAMRQRGSFAPLAMGGDTRSRRVEAHADYLLRLHRLEPDLTLSEICARLERARGEKVSPSMIWRFFDRHDITYKKSQRTRASRTAPTCLNVAGDGSTLNSTSTRRNWCSSTRPRRRPTWRPAIADVDAVSASVAAFRTATTRQLRLSAACAFAAPSRPRPTTAP
jgi:transposase